MAATILAGRGAHDALEGGAEGAFGFIAERQDIFGFLARFAGIDVRNSGAKTQAALGWKPVQQGLLADLEQRYYFGG